MTELAGDVRGASRADEGVLGCLAGMGGDKESGGLGPLGETGVGGGTFLSSVRSVGRGGRGASTVMVVDRDGESNPSGVFLDSECFRISSSELPVAELMLSLEDDAGLSRQEVDALGLGTGLGLGEIAGDDVPLPLGERRGEGRGNN